MFNLSLSSNYGYTAKLVVGLISSEGILLQKIMNVLSKTYGKIDIESPIMDFDYTEYYKDELGNSLKKKLFSFEKLISIEDSYKIKKHTCNIEKKFSKMNKRLINIDPGYVDHAKLVLFTTKDYNHRIYLNKGIFGEVSLNYNSKKSSFQANDWAYPDYRTDKYLSFFNEVRAKFAQQMKK